MLKNIMRRTLSIVLSIVMLLTLCSAATSMLAQAAVSVASGPSNPTLYFVVPEVIYLEPEYNSGTATTKAAFQFYVNNELNSSNGSLTLKTGEETTGKIYFNYANASSVKIAYEWLNADGTTPTGSATITYGDSKARSGGGSEYYTMTPGSSPINITAGSSPNMTSSTTGIYIRWIATFKDTGDALEKTATAYTYVYKPYVAPVGVAERTVNDRGDNHYGQCVSWISGVHGVVDAGSRYPNVALTKDGNGLMTFSSTGARKDTTLGVTVGGVGGSDNNTHYELVAQFASNDNEKSRWKYTGMDNTGVGGWLNESAGNAIASKTIRYQENTKTGHSSGDDAFHNLEYSPTATLFADTSRYSNFNQIPNISAGLMVTDDEASTGNGAWFVADYVGDWTTKAETDYNSNQNSAKTLWNNYRDHTGNTLLGYQGNYSATVSGAESEGVKYNYKWNHAFSSSGNCTVATGYYNHDKGSNTSGDSIWNIAELRLKLTCRNNTTLRNAIQNAIHYLPMFQDCFYDSTNATWVNFTELYNAGYMALTKLDGGFTVKANVNGSLTTYSSVDTYVTALNNAITQLSNGTGRLSRTATQSNVAITPANDGSTSYKVLEFTGGNAAPTTSFKTYQTVTFTADSVTGYTFKGVQSTESPANYTVGNTIAKPTYTTSATGATTFNTSTGKIVFTHANKTGTKNGNLYYTYFYEANTFSVKFNANNGNGAAMPDQQFVYNVAQELSENTYTRKGYTFKGWGETATSTSAKYSDKQIVSNLTTTNGGTIQLYALWTPIVYSLDFDVNGGTYTSSIPSTYTIESTVPMPTAEKAGYSLSGWRADGSGNWGSQLYTAGLNVAAGKYNNVSFTASWVTNTYTVTFNGNGATSGSMQTQNFTYDVAQNLSANQFSRTGYSFKGWAYTDSATTPAFADKEQVINLTDVDGKNIPLHAVWGAVTYNILYNEDGGVILDALGSYTTSYTINDAIQLPTNVTKEGYSFTGWQPTQTSGAWNNATTYSGTEAAGKHGSVTLKAQWAASNYTISYDAAGGDISSSTYTTSYNVNTSVTLPSARWTGYTFQGWIANDVGNWGESTYGAGKVGTGMFGNVTLTAQWIGITYYVSFNSNGGSGTMRDQSMIYGQEASLNANVFTRNGYTFIGWSTNSAATTAEYEDKAIVSSLTTYANTSVSLYAVWSPVSYTITYNTNGGTIEQEGTTSYTINDRIVLPTASRNGYTLSGWTPTSTVGTWTALQVYNGTIDAGKYGDVELKAQWSKIPYTITWNGAGGTLSGVYTTSYDIETTDIKLPTATRSGYAFTKWQANSVWDNVSFTDAAPTGKTGNVTITAVWAQRTYTVSFDANGGEGEMANQTIQFDTATQLTANTFTRYCYTFQGWAYTSNATSSDIADGAPAYNLAANDGDTVTLYAVWKATTFNVKYDANGATGSAYFLSNSSVMMDDSVALRGYAEDKQIATISGASYQFAGWSLTKNALGEGTAAYQAGDNFTVNASLLEAASVNWSGSRPVITIYAVWTLRTYTVSFDANGGTGNMADQVIQFNAATPLTANSFTRDDFIFLGWAKTATATEPEYEDGATVTNLAAQMGDTVTLYAVWADAAIALQLVENSGATLDAERKILYGFDTGLSIDDMTAYLGVEGNGHLEYAEGTSTIGTGTTVDLVNDRTGEVVETYTIVIFGDLNGDGEINNSDMPLIKGMIVGTEECDPALSLYAYAADLNNDGEANNSDLPIFKSIVFGSVVIDQATREEI